jgi:CRISPR/Cas system CMR subunit Cmr4 (Cas7 group RAMP superfamily)
MSNPRGTKHESRIATQFADARLLLLPVRSLAGTFAWVTSPYVLRRFARDVDATTTTALAVIDDWKKPQSPDADNKNGKLEQCKIATGSVLKLTGSTTVLHENDMLTGTNFFATVRKVELGDYMHLTQHTMAALLWFKRYAQSVLGVQLIDTVAHR